MKLLKLWVLLALVFLAGIVAGAVGTRVVVRHVVRDAVLHPEKMQAVMERNLTRQLRLDNRQQVELHQILSDSHQEMKELRLEYQPRFIEAVSNADGQITALLTPEQQTKFEKFKQDRFPFLGVMEQNR